MQQRSKEWHEFRKNHIGASDAPAIMGVSPWKTELDLYNEKKNCNSSSNTNNYAMQRGIELESMALAVFEAQTGYLMMPRIMIHKQHDWMSASLDGLELEGKFAVEIKCPGLIDHQTALDGNVPEKYMPQLQHTMEVTGLDAIFYMSYRDDNDFKILEVKKDHEYTKLLIKKELDFWDRVQRRDPPLPTDRDIKEITDPNWRHYVDQWAMLQLEKKDIEKRENEIRENLIYLANNHSAQGFGLKLAKIQRKGNVDYSKVPELKGLDLEPYRKSSSESWRITLNDKNDVE